MDELRQTLWLAMELEETRTYAQEQLKMRDEEISQLKDLLSRANKERDEAQEKCQKVFLEKQILQQQLLQSAPNSGISSIEDDPRRGIDSINGFSASDCDESIVSWPQQLQEEPPPPPPELPTVDRLLPEKGKFLQAVMKAGPLLQTLLLAGPLPQWRHPPPPLETYQIPPPPLVIPPPPAQAISQKSPYTCNNCNNCGTMNRKRGLTENSDSSVELKYQRVALH